MTIKHIALLATAITAMLLSACGGGGGGNNPPGDSVISAISGESGIARIAAGAGSADVGTTVSIAAGGTGQSTANADGSFSFDATIGAGAGASQAGAILTVQYVKGGETLQTVVSVTLQDDLITKPLFATGSGPQSMRLINDSLYIANSLDNEVALYSLSGTKLENIQFDEFASPGYIAATETNLYVVTNGSNEVNGYGLFSLNTITGDAFAFTDPSVAFIGPGKASANGEVVYVPRNQIAAFADFGSGDLTTYADGEFSAIDFSGVTSVESEFTTTGYNPQVCEYDPVGGLLYVVCAGRVHFDTDFEPFVDSNATLEIYDPADGMDEVAVLSLGMVGANSIAVSPDGSFAYLGNQLDGRVYRADLTAQSANFAPITLTSEFTYISDVEYTPDGKYVLASSYNTDELYVINAATGEVSPGALPGPFDLSLSGEFLAGCQDVEVRADPLRPGKYEAYVLYGIANGVARVSLP